MTFPLSARIGRRIGSLSLCVGLCCFSFLFAGSVFGQNAQTEGKADLSRADAAVVAAQQAGNTEGWILALIERARVSEKLRLNEEAWKDLEEAVALARQFGHVALEATVLERAATHWVAVGDASTAQNTLWLAFQTALSASVPQKIQAHRILQSLGELVASTAGDDARGLQIKAWLDLLEGSPQAPQPSWDMQPQRATVQVASNEFARTRLVLANSTIKPATGSLSVKTRSALQQWQLGAVGLTLSLGPIGTDAAHEITRTIKLAPGQQLPFTIEIEPHRDNRETQEPVVIEWRDEQGNVQSRSEIAFAQKPISDASPSVACTQQCEITLSPLWSVPIYEELYYRGNEERRVLDILPDTDVPCRLEMWEIAADTGANVCVAIDADGDGEYLGEQDFLDPDYNSNHYPDVLFANGKSAASIELRVYPLSDAGGAPQVVRVWLSEDGRWSKHAVNQVK